MHSCDCGVGDVEGVILTLIRDNTKKLALSVNVNVKINDDPNAPAPFLKGTLSCVGVSLCLR